MTWRPIAEHVFPWEISKVVVIAQAKDDPTSFEAFLCECADGGYYYEEGSLMAIDELGWIPLLWAPAPDLSQVVS